MWYFKDGCNMFHHYVLPLIPPFILSLQEIFKEDKIPLISCPDTRITIRPSISLFHSYYYFQVSQKHSIRRLQSRRGPQKSVYAYLYSTEETSGPITPLLFWWDSLPLWYDVFNIFCHSHPTFSVHSSILWSAKFQQLTYTSEPTHAHTHTHTHTHTPERKLAYLQNCRCTCPLWWILLSISLFSRSFSFTLFSIKSMSSYNSKTYPGSLQILGFSHEGTDLQRGGLGWKFLP